jgi:hypothetical protein
MRDSAPAKGSLDASCRDAVHRSDAFRNYVPPKTMRSLGSNIGSYSHPALNLIVYCSPRVRISATFALDNREWDRRAKRSLAFTVSFFFF